VQLLLEKGAEVDTKDGSGQTLLSLAAEKGYEVVEQLLLRRGALLIEDLYGLVALFTL
jgi:ankyrin repeat protein